MDACNILSRSIYDTIQRFHHCLQRKKKSILHYSSSSFDVFIDYFLYIGLKTPWSPSLWNSLTVIYNYRLLGMKREKCCNERTDYSLKAKQHHERRQVLDFTHRTWLVKFKVVYEQLPLQPALLGFVKENLFVALPPGIRAITVQKWFDINLLVVANKAQIHCVFYFLWFDLVWLAYKLSSVFTTHHRYNGICRWFLNFDNELFFKLF